jgi:hypothetical protein
MTLKCSKNIDTLEGQLDTRDQTHITILENEWKDVPAGMDSRRFRDIRAGLDPDFCHLDQIHPRGYVVIHEVCAPLLETVPALLLFFNKDTKKKVP